MTSPADEGWREAVERVPHLAVGRVVIGEGLSTPCSVITKYVPRREVLVHRIVQHAQPHIVPPVLAAWPTPDDSMWVMVLPDLKAGMDAADSSAGSPAAIGDLLRAGLERLAVIHHTFAGARELAGLGLLTPVALAQVHPGTVDRLGQRNDEWSLGLRLEQLRIWGQLEHTLPAYRDTLADEESWTLVHGDLHAGNVVRAAGGSIWLIDWGSACMQASAWNLATSSAHLVSAYLVARARAGSPQAATSFSRQLRAATAVRLHGAVGDLLEDQSPVGISHKLRVQAVRSCIARALQAHVTVGFLGG